MKNVEIESQRLRKAVADLTLDKLILSEAAKGNFEAPPERVNDSETASLMI
jgi:hypothetical protein